MGKGFFLFKIIYLKIQSLYQIVVYDYQLGFKFGVEVIPHGVYC